MRFSLPHSTLYSEIFYFIWTLIAWQIHYSATKYQSLLKLPRTRNFFSSVPATLLILLFSWLFFLNRYIFSAIRFHRLFWKGCANIFATSQIPRNHEHNIQQTFGTWTRNHHFSGKFLLIFAVILLQFLIYSISILSITSSNSALPIESHYFIGIRNKTHTQNLAAELSQIEYENAVHKLGEYKWWLSKSISSGPSGRWSFFHMPNQRICGRYDCTGSICPLLLLYTCKYFRLFYYVPIFSMSISIIDWHECCITLLLLSNSCEAILPSCLSIFSSLFWVRSLYISFALSFLKIVWRPNAVSLCHSFVVLFCFCFILTKSSVDQSLGIWSSERLLELI